MRIYLATSMKNGSRSAVVAERLRDHGHTVFDPANNGPAVEGLLAEQAHLWGADHIRLTYSPAARQRCLVDLDYLRGCHGCVLVLPCGRSSHLEAGVAVGAGRPLWIFGNLPAGEFDVMHNLAEKMYRLRGLETLLEAIDFWEGTHATEVAVWNVLTRKKWPGAVQAWKRLELVAAEA